MFLDIPNNNNNTNEVDIISNITEDFIFFEKNMYNIYIKYYRNLLYSLFINILMKNESIKNIILLEIDLVD